MTLDPSPISPDELRAILAQLSISQNELARRIGVTSAAVALWSTGKIVLRGPTAALIRIMIDTN